jgi:hypothetical protein
LFLSLSAFVVGFAFMIGGANSKCFEVSRCFLQRSRCFSNETGSLTQLLHFLAGNSFILVCHPYDIGDRIHVSHPENDTIGDGSMTWFVEDLGLYSTVSCGHVFKCRTSF